VKVKDLLGEEEWALLHAILNFLLCAGLVTCKNIPGTSVSDNNKDSESATTTEGSKTTNSLQSK
jgi:hypothetical protein